MRFCKTCNDLAEMGFVDYEDEEDPPHLRDTFSRYQVITFTGTKRKGPNR